MIEVMKVESLVPAIMFDRDSLPDVFDAVEIVYTFKVVDAALRIPWKAARWWQSNLPRIVVVKCNGHRASIDCIPSCIHRLNTSIRIPEWRDGFISDRRVETQSAVSGPASAVN